MTLSFTFVTEVSLVREWNRDTSLRLMLLRLSCFALLDGEFFIHLLCSKDAPPGLPDDFHAFPSPRF
jgi:hypothetical protein